MIDVAEPQVRPAAPERPHTAEPAAPAKPSGSRVWRVVKTVAGWVPTVLTVAALGGLGWFGHHYDWALPASPLAAEEDAGPAWCEEHGVAEDACINCTAGLVEEPADLSFCKVHGVHGCVLENPSLAEVPGVDDREVTDADLERAARALAVKPRRENLSLSRLPGTRVQFASVEAAREAGVEVAPVETRAVTESVPAAGEVRYDATRTAHVSPPAEGIVRSVLVEPGATVEAGQPLATVDSQKAGGLRADLAAARSEARRARTERDRLAPLVSRNVIAGKRLTEADAELEAATAAVDRAERALRNLGLDPAAGSDGDANLITVFSPLNGRVVNLHAVVGEVVGRGESLMTVSDTSRVWVDLRVPAEDAAFAEVGRTVRYTPDGTDRIYEGEVIWVDSELDPATRTVRVRAAVPNPDGALRNESFGAGELVLRVEDEAVAVPAEALMWDGENTLAFVRDARWFEEGRPKFFTARSVRPGVDAGNGYVEVIAGLLPGEVVATGGGDVLRAQLLKSNLGAGCTCGH